MNLIKTLFSKLFTKQKTTSADVSTKLEEQDIEVPVEEHSNELSIETLQVGIPSESNQPKIDPINTTSTITTSDAAEKTPPSSARKSSFATRERLAKLRASTKSQSDQASSTENKPAPFAKRERLAKLKKAKTHEGTIIGDSSNVANKAMQKPLTSKYQRKERPLLGESIKPTSSFEFRQRIEDRILFVNHRAKPLRAQDFVEVAKKLKCDPKLLQAITLVEGKGFFKSGKVVIEFVPSVFSQLTRGEYDTKYPQVSKVGASPASQQAGERNYELLEQAIKLDRIAALKSTKFGIFQILGKDFELCNFNNLEDFVKEQIKGEKHQLNSFASWLKSKDIDVMLQQNNIPLFAKNFKGREAIRLKYDKRILEQLAKLK